MSSICKVNFRNTKAYFIAIVSLLCIAYTHRTSHMIFSVPTSQLESSQTLNKSSPGKLHPHSSLQFLLLSRTWCGRSLWSVWPTCPSCILSQALICPQQASDQQMHGCSSPSGGRWLGHGGPRKGTLPWPGAKGCGCSLATGTCCLLPSPSCSVGMVAKCSGHVGAFASQKPVGGSAAGCCLHIA